MGSIKKFLKVNKITIILLLIITVVSVCIGKLIVTCVNYKEIINQDITTISNLEEQVEDTVISKNSLEQCIKTLDSKNEELSIKNVKYKEQLHKYETELAKYKEQSEEQNKTKSRQVLSLDTGFRSWMPYTALTSGTEQYNVVHKASPNKYGVLEYDNRAVVAVGFGWNLKIGDTATVTTTNGTYKIIVGDWKAKCDTDNSNKVTTSNGCVVEFIVDRNSLDQRIKTSGSVASINKYSGKVLDIVPDGSNILN